MPNDFFRFQQFTVHQSLCAMKVGTDGTLLGSWAAGGDHILDIGTGTGLIALMMAQRFPEARIDGVDIDSGAVRQARLNVSESPFSQRITVCKADVAVWDGRYDAIVCNPPFFVHSLTSPDEQRTVARHAATLTYRQLMTAVSRLLTDDGECSVIVPFDYRSLMEAEASLAGLFKTREWAVKTTPAKPPRRYLLALRKHSAPLDAGVGVIGSEWYNKLMEKFYL